MRNLFIVLLLLLLMTISVFAQDDAPAAQLVEIEAADGLLLQGDYYAQSEASPAVLLLHMLGGQRSAWQPLIAPLYDAGYSVLAVDMRGHGATGGDREWTLAEADHQAWLDWLRQQEGVRADAVSIIGGSIGGNMALIGCAADMSCVTAIAISPGQDYRGVRPGDAVATGFAGRSALMIGGWRDGAVAADILAMTANSNAEIGIRLFDTRTHGTNFLTGEDSQRVINLILNWLDEHTPEAADSAG